MFTPLRGLRIGRRAITIGFVLAGFTATAVGAASGNPIWHGALRPHAATGDAATTTDSPPPPVTEPVTTEPTTTAPPTTPPPTPEPVVAPSAVEQPAAAVVTEPAAEPPTAPTAPTAEEPAAAEPATTEAPAPPAAAPAPSPKPNDNVVPATLSLSCTLAADGASGPVACSWSGALPDGFASFVLLRGDPDGKGRVPYRSGDPAASSFLDTTASAGKHSYVVVALDAADHPLAHSNMVPVQIAAT
jgi:hypothetical protein